MALKKPLKTAFKHRIASCIALQWGLSSGLYLHSQVWARSQLAENAFRKSCDFGAKFRALKISSVEKKQLSNIGFQAALHCNGGCGVVCTFTRKFARVPSSQKTRFEKVANLAQIFGRSNYR